MAEGIMCEVCGTGPFVNIGAHNASKKHQENLRKSERVTELPLGLKEPVLATDKTSQERAKMVRKAFSELGWPCEAHTGTVRDFLDEYSIPYILNRPRG